MSSTFETNKTLLSLRLLNGKITVDQFMKQYAKLESDESARIGGGCDQCFEGCEKCRPRAKTHTKHLKLPLD